MNEQQQREELQQDINCTWQFISALANKTDTYVTPERAQQVFDDWFPAISSANKNARRQQQLLLQLHEQEESEFL